MTIPSGSDARPLHARFWSGNEPKGVLVIAHGLGEHGGCYSELAQALTARRGLVDVLAIDFRGHGKSPGARGVVKRYEELRGDLRAGVEEAGRLRPGRPIFILGHSNGGQVALRFVLEDRPELAGLVLSNPSLKLAVDVPWHKLGIAWVLRAVAPGVTLASDLPSASLSRDPGFEARRRADDLRHGRISAPLFFGMVEGGRRIARRFDEIKLPVLMILGGSDPVVDHRAALAAYDELGSGDKTLRLDPHAVHEPLNDLGRGAVIEDIAHWIEARLPDEAP